jgi:Tfp pilus assembly protein PilZ
VSWATPEEFREAYARDLIHGALFVPTRQPCAPGDAVRVTLQLAFCAGRLDLDAEVVTAVSPAMSRTGATPGVSVRIAEPVGELRRRLEQSSGMILPEADEPTPDDSRRSPRFPARAAVVLEVAGRHFPAETVDVSYNGMLALLGGVDLGEDTEARVILTHPGSGAQLAVEGRIANQTRCNHGVMAIGIQFHYAMERIEEMTRFIDELRGFHRARKLASISGSLRETSLETVLETFSAVSSEGTLVLTRRDDEGKVAYRDGEILYAMTGLVSGGKALGRMFTWSDASFEFHPEVEPIDVAASALSLESAIISAAVDRDEIAHLGLDRLGPDASFRLDETRFAAVEPELDGLQRQVAENAGMGFPLAALLDILPASDAAILKTLADLIEAGILGVV